jgi:hypothetical protein
MPTNTYVALDKVTVGTATPSITFSSIPQGYTDLVVVAQVLGNSSTNLKFRINNDTASNYSGTYIFGNGSSAGSGRVSNQTSALAYGSGITNGSFILQFMNYSNTTTNKTVLCRGDDASNQTNAWVDLYRSTSAITRIDLLGDAANFSVGSTFSLYGIASSGAGAKATGGTVTSDANYYYHTFLSSGTFTPTQSLTCDYLVVAGGGGAGGGNGGGGGAGGLRSTVTATGGGGSLETPLSLTATAYTVTIGAGGAGTASTNPGNAGNNSVFSTITSTGGGYGSGGTNNSAGGSGGSGGGGTAVSGAGGARTTGQGFAGGAGGNSSDNGGGGGGGAGVVGGTATLGFGGNGGNGVATVISGTSVTYAGGGGGHGGSGGGTGGTGGGGAGAVSGTANTGGGGGGWNGSAVGSGGSGIVIVRYAK